jgi:alkanesulfonate monooxygenase SsuD/methylene tetrahydromethanopterin reductase-like flavin-dependent oxidoreductase (luciferase family)
MTDYGHPITFGLSLYPSVGLIEDNRRLARAADEAGLDYIAIQDHAYNAESSTRGRSSRHWRPRQAGSRSCRTSSTSSSDRRR